MSDSRDAEEAPLPVPARPPHWRESLFMHTGLQATLHWSGRRQVCNVQDIRDQVDRTRALLVIVDWPRPSIRMAWVRWDPDRMSLEYTATKVRAAVEAEPCEGDAALMGRDQLHCLNGEPIMYQPIRKVEVRIGGRWHDAQLQSRHEGLGGQSVVRVRPWIYEQQWSACVAYRRFYCWDPATIRPRDADQREQP
ncbi:hypothetical protein ACWIID_02260 [Streptomyces phaeochromogenes]